MEERIEKIIVYLSRYNEYKTGSDIAANCALSERTVYRLIPHVMKWLEDKGCTLISKTRLGYCIEGDRDFILSSLKSENYSYFSFSRDQRQNLMVMILVLENSPVKISDLARRLHISDTSVTNDIRDIEERISAYDLKIINIKGSGISLSGSENNLRSCCADSFTQLVDPDVFIQFIEHSVYNAGTKKVEQYLEICGIDENWSILSDIIRRLEIRLGYHFSYSGYATLLVLLSIIKIRAHVSSSYWTIAEHSDESPYIVHAEFIFENLDLFADEAVPEQELCMMALIISGMEIGEIEKQKFLDYFENEQEQLTQILDQALVSIEQLTGYFLKLESRLRFSFMASLSTLIKRNRYIIPIWHETWLNLRKLNFMEYEFSRIIMTMVEEKFGIKLKMKNLYNLLLSFSALFEETQKKKVRRVRASIVCIEGIGLASYLKSRLLRIFPDLYIADLLSYNAITEEYIRENCIDLVISTFELQKFSVPVFRISLPFNEQEVFNSLFSVIEAAGKKDAVREVAVNRPPGEQAALGEEISVDLIMSIIQNFFCMRRSSFQGIETIIKELIETLDIPRKHRGQLFKDFMNREKLGDLIFEELGVRVLHCRSTAVREPFAGVVQFDDRESMSEGYKCILVMAAPVDAKKKMLNVLSSLITALSDEKEFAHILADSSIETIKKFLFWMYGNYMRFDVYAENQKTNSD